MVGWVIAFVLYDLCYYCSHRAGHEIKLFWAAHVSTTKRRLQLIYCSTSDKLRLFIWLDFLHPALFHWRPRRDDGHRGCAEFDLPVLGAH